MTRRRPVWIAAVLTTLCQAAEHSRGALLIRFGADGRAGVDWSGSVSPAPKRIAPWQFDGRDELAADRWKCSTRQESYWDTPYERSMRGTSRRDKVTGKGIIVEFDREFRITTAQGSFTVTPEPSLWLSPRRFLDGRVEVSAVPSVEYLTTGAAAEDYPSLIEDKDGTVWLAWQSYEDAGDQVYVRRLAGGAWSPPEPLAQPGGDYFGTAIAQDNAGRVWVVWSAQVASNFDLYARSWDGKRWSGIERLTQAPGSDIYHALAADRSGNLHLAWMSARNGNFDIYWKNFDGKRWSTDRRVSESAANDWEPALAAAPDGAMAILWDTYAGGSHDVVMRLVRGASLGAVTTIAGAGAFEARPSAQYDAQGRLWIAWEEGDWNWGKDYGTGIEENGRGLLVRRHTRVGVLAGGRLMEPAASLAEAIPQDLRQVLLAPRLALASDGTPWVFFRYRVNLPQQGGGESSSRAMWRQGAARLVGERWSPMIEFPLGFGRIDAPLAAIRTRDGNLRTAWASDGRLWPNGAPRDQELATAVLPGSGGGEARLVAFQPTAENLPPSHPNEAKDLARVRSYRTKAGGKQYRIVRGDIHRHTDISWDGNRDGSLHDSYRYALDAAGFDYLGVCDHQAGNMNLYTWWMIQKAADLFHIQDRFAPLYSYERSLPWPNGHRNVVFATRGRPVLAISEAERKGTEGAAKLYEYLRKFGGFTSSHTSATGAGTDFRDSDEELEPVVEIYQGYRRNYEGPGTPRSPAAGEEARFAAGYVWNAWAKGIKLGVQSSSDHVSTHISYAAFYVDRIDRESILRAAKARRAYAATDNLVIDLRMGDHFMGDSFTASGAQPLEAYVAGTGPIARVEVIKNNRIVYTAQGSGAETRFSYTDREAAPGESYYYIRVEQEDGQIGWSSPIWVTYRGAVP